MLTENPSVMDNLARARNELKTAWRERVNASEDQFHRSRAEVEAKLALCGRDATSAEIEALMQARARESAALDQFMHLVRISHDLRNCPAK